MYYTCPRRLGTIRSSLARGMRHRHTIILKSVTFTMTTDSPPRAPPRISVAGKGLRNGPGPTRRAPPTASHCAASHARTPSWRASSSERWVCEVSCGALTSPRSTRVRSTASDERPARPSCRRQLERGGRTGAVKPTQRRKELPWLARWGARPGAVGLRAAMPRCPCLRLARNSAGSRVSAAGPGSSETPSLAWHVGDI